MSGPAPTLELDYVVIGSGFGGAVSALRLTEKGWRVAVLEMGKRWRPEDFAETNWDLRKYLWMPGLGLHGIQQISMLPHVVVLHGAGVGGGSLVYANTLVVPQDPVLRDPRWPAGRDWATTLAPHFATARRMLGATPAPEVFHADELLREVVEEETGRGATFRRHEVAIFFGTPGERAPDPYFGGRGPERTGCTLCGACMTGCRTGAKNSLDRNYLHLAEGLGCEIHAETRVTDVRPAPGGGWEIEAERSTRVLARERRVYRARGVVFAAGALGTVKLLLACKARGSLPDLSPQLGNFVRTNSEALVGALAPDERVDFSRGIAITSGVDADANTHMEIVRYGKGQNAMGALVTHLTPDRPPWPRWLRWVGGLLRHPLRYARVHRLRGWATRTAIVLVMQPLDSYLRLRLRRRLGRATLTSVLESGQRPPTSIPIADRIAERLAAKIGGLPGSNVLEVLGNRSSTAHILGGAVLASDPSQGVCDPVGRVFGYEGLWVADGAAVPVNLGVNPSLTITAVAEHVMAAVPAKAQAGSPPPGRAGDPSPGSRGQVGEGGRGSASGRTP